MHTVTILGAGYVGLTTAALLAHADTRVYVVEPNPERLATIKQGQSFFYEAGINPLIKQAVSSGRLIATDSYEISVPESSIVFSCVGTPDNPDGSSNLSYVNSAAETAAKLMQPGSIYVQKSTVPVGTGRKLINRYFASSDIDYVSNPEFLREGTAVIDTLFFDRVVAGGDDQRATDTILDTYRRLEAHRDEIAQLAEIEPKSTSGKYIATSLASAELIKVTANAFLALKISFANSIAQLADAAGADITEVMDAVGADQRIGRAFLNAGRGYGGGCFPKDVSGLIASGLEHGVDLEIMRAASAVNAEMPGYAVEKLITKIGSISGVPVTVLGLAFKSGTSDVRRSPGITMAKLLAKAGAEVKAYDPEGNGEATSELGPSIQLCASRDEAIKDAAAIIIATDWPEFAENTAAYQGKVIVDAVNMLTNESAQGLDIIGIGRSQSSQLA